MVKGIIIGNNNILPQTEDEILITAINVSDTEFTEDDNGKVFMQDGQVVFDTDGSVTCSVVPTSIGKGANFDTEPRHKIYFCDCTLGNITVNYEDFNEHTFVKIDATPNTVILTPASGTINGAATYTLTTQYQKVTVVSDGTNYYV